MSTTNPTNQTTEWDDLQRKFGNLPPLEKEIKEEELYFQNIERIENEDILKKKNIKELNRLEEDCVDDEYIKIIQKYKRDRLNQIKKNKELDIFGDVYEITKENFITEINDASKLQSLKNIKNKDPYEDQEEEEQERDKNEDQERENNIKDEGNNRQQMMKTEKGKNNKGGTFVVLHLYSDNVMACKVLNNIFQEIAKKYKHIKFAKGIYNKIIENYPESKMPTVLIYYNGICIQQICNLLLYINGGLANLNLKTFEQLLKKYDVLKIKKNKKETNDALSEDSDEEDENNRNNLRTRKQYTAFNMFNRNYKNDNEEDDGDSSDEETDKEMVTKGYASSYLDNKMRKFRM